MTTRPYTYKVVGVERITDGDTYLASDWPTRWRDQYDKGS